MSPVAEERSRLHDRVRAYIERSSRGEATGESFDELGLAIARFQAAQVPAYARLLSAAGVHPRDVVTVGELPAIPTDAFRLARIATHAPAEDSVVFRTSGTTGLERGAHPFATTATYELGAAAWGRWALFFDDPKDMTAIVIGPRGEAAAESSLQFMLDLFSRRFAAHALHVEARAGAPIDPSELRAALSAAGERGPAIVMGTSFAFVHALDTLGGSHFTLPPGSRAMHTGGFKGRSREVAPDVLRAEIAATFGIETAAVVGEYGMTELSSQLYEGTLRARAGLATPGAEHGRFIAPPWLRVVAVDPETLAPVPPGQNGILRFEDLANVDSAISVQTADFGRCREGTVELFGRAAGAPPRGCSLAIEELLSAS